MNAMTPPQTSLSPFLLFYLLSCCAPSLLHTFMYIDPKRSTGAVHSAHQALRWRENPTQLCNSSVEPWRMCPQGQTHSLQVQPQTQPCLWFLRARHCCAHTGSMILGQKLVWPLKCSLNLVLGFPTAPFFPILHGTCCRRSNQGMKM